MALQRTDLEKLSKAALIEIVLSLQEPQIEYKNTNRGRSDYFATQVRGLREPKPHYTDVRCKGLGVSLGGLGVSLGGLGVSLGGLGVSLGGLGL